MSTETEQAKAELPTLRDRFSEFMYSRHPVTVSLGMVLLGLTVWGAVQVVAGVMGWNLLRSGAVHLVISGVILLGLSVVFFCMNRKWDEPSYTFEIMCITTLSLGMGFLTGVII